MTAWQDQQPPQSRRQLRLSAQRNGARDGAVDSELPEEQRVDVRIEDLHADTAETPVPHIESFARPAWDAPARRSAAHEDPAPASQQPRSRAEASGRRAQHSSPQEAPVDREATDVEAQGAQTSDAAAPERPSQVPSYGGPSFAARAATPSQFADSDVLRPRRDEDRAEDESVSRTDDTPPAYRVRDFSPESRRSAFSSTSELSASDWNHKGAAGEPGNLDYHTQQGPSQYSQPSEASEASDVQVPLTEPVVAPQAEPEAANEQQAQAERPLTRRELRALRQASEPDVEDVGSQPVEVQPEAAQPDIVQPEVVQPEVVQPVAARPETEQPVTRRRRAQQSTEESAQVPPPLQAPAGSGQQPSREISDVMAEFDSLALGNTVDGAPGEVAKAYTPPAGHWSTQGNMKDDAEPEGLVPSRNVAATGSAVTSNHLVMSSVPTVNDLLLPFSPTGEIMVTGTIDLPASLGSTGAHPARYDHSDVDTLLEASDREDSNVDSAPVRAIRAVSTHTSSRGLIGSGKPPRSGRLPMVLAISTAAAAAVVVVLFVAGFMLHMF